ncbi:hypothetical protein CG710_004555 [Lachnotalea glycerini]|uniref:Type VII secretion protein EssB n=1 Tax=Lachnotalea glycerini TaxID=1763509 RepID=A0A371JHP8_9FIRM|nr:hypothetical protein CG710_004555 [Lachnotalea glycerini]
MTVEQTNLIEVKKKSAFIAKNQFEYKKIIFPNAYLIDMTMEEEKEDLVFCYNIQENKSLLEIRKDDILTILAVLINMEQLQKAITEYNFTMNPDNLYYNINRQIFVKERDIYQDGRGYEEEEFLDNYKALIGFALQKKYSYEDFRKGGQKLLSKNQLQNCIREAKSIQEVKNILIKEYERVENERRDKKLLLNKSSLQRMKAAIVTLSVFFVVFTGYIGYRLIIIDPYTEAIIQSDDAYIAQDYVSCIDFMDNVKVSNMKVTQKYILANSYIRSENLTQEQKNNILANISLKEIPERLEYWIYLGRGDTDKAIDIAMQQSDDELLLYAYMKKKSYIEADTGLTGEEKTQQLKNISTLMEPLIEQYDAEDK